MTKPTTIDDSRSSSKRRDSSSPTNNNSSNSAPIPFPQTHVRRTYSEVALDQANKVAEWRETQMYHRLLTGMILRSHEKGLDQHPKIIRSLENLVLTQASPISNKHNEEWGVITEDDQGMDRTRNSCDSSYSPSRQTSSVSSWSSAMNGCPPCSSSLSRRPSRARLTLAPLKESLKSSFKGYEECIFHLELWFISSFRESCFATAPMK